MMTNPRYNLLMLSGDNSSARGIDGTFYQMLAQFSAYWQRIDILTPTAPDAAPQCIHGNVYVHPAPYHRAGQPLFIRRKGSELLQQRPYHLVTSHDYGFFVNGLGAWWLIREREIPLVSEIHHIEGMPRAVTWREQLWRQAAQRYIPFITPHVAAFRTVHEGEVPQILRSWGVADEKILVLPSLYLDLDLLHPLDDVAPAYDVLFVGRLARNKGVLLLIDALAQVVQTHPQVTLGIRGEGDLREAIEIAIAERGLGDNVRWLPRVASDELALLYNRAKMLVCASTVEGNPRVTAEAMACGVPVISTPVGIMPELITQGESGFLVDWDAAAIASHIRRLLDDETWRQQIGAAGRQRVQPYAAQRTIRRYAQGYHQLIETHQRA